MFGDISGKSGGDVYKKDKSGLHDTALARHIQKEPTAFQKKLRSWYAGKKKEEHEKGPPPEEYPEPKHETTAIIYSLEEIWGYKKPTLLPPETKTWDTAGFYPDQIRDWIQMNWKPMYEMWGLSKDLMFLMMLKWWYVYKYIKGFSSDLALTAAKALMNNFIAEGAAEVAVPILSTWVFCICYGVYVDFMDYWEGVEGLVSFTRGRVLIRTKQGLFWGSIMSRESKKLYSFKIAKDTGWGSYRWQFEPDTPAYIANWLYLNQFWTTILQGIVFWNVYSWDTIRCRHRGAAYMVDQNTYWMECPPSQVDYWGHDIGWQNPDPYDLYYYNLLEEHFQYPGHPAEPL